MERDTTVEVSLTVVVRKIQLVLDEIVKDFNGNKKNVQYSVNYNIGIIAGWLELLDKLEELMPILEKRGIYYNKFNKQWYLKS